VRLWDLRDPTAAPRVLSGHEDWVWSVTFSPDGETVAMGSADGTVRLWDLRDPTAAPRVLSGHEYGVLSVAFSPDGETLATGSDDSTVRLWVVPIETLVELGCRKVRRNLTSDEWNRYLPGQPYRKTCLNLPGPGE
jgi:WD40 repeat protein